jgi:hypothetical protein
MRKQCLQFIPSMSRTESSDSPRLDKTAIPSNQAALPGCPTPRTTNLKETIMNATKNLFAAAVLAVIGTSAFAVEAEQFVPATGSLTRAEVKAELTRAQAAGEIAQVSASYGSFAPVARAEYKAQDTKAARSRDEVRAEARVKAQSNAFSSLYIGG